MWLPRVGGQPHRRSERATCDMGRQQAWCAWCSRRCGGRKLALVILRGSLVYMQVAFWGISRLFHSQHSVSSAIVMWSEVADTSL